MVYWSMFGAWLSLVERLVRDQEVGGSNPLAPTKFSDKLEALEGLTAHPPDQGLKTNCKLHLLGTGSSLLRAGLNVQDHAASIADLTR